MALSNMNSMMKRITTQAIQIFVVYAATVALVAWQWKFVKSGIESNPYMNGVIIATFLFGTFLAVWAMVDLPNEARAVKAIQEIYRDIQLERSNPEIIESIRFPRIMEPGTVFSRPSLLGHVYDLTLEELQRTKGLRLSMGTMQTLMDAVQSRIAQSRSLLGYITGLCVFLGLIGTFIGLMKMVGSVGGIIGGLANSDGGSADSIKQLLKDLEGPMIGMATGFSASLFGLLGSMFLGLIARFVAQAQNAIKYEFEGWLASISALENEELEGDKQNNSRGIEAQGGFGQISGVMVSLMSGFRRANETLSRTTAAISLLADRHEKQSRILEKTIGSADSLVKNFEVIATRLEDLDARIEATSARPILERMRTELSGQLLLLVEEAKVSARKLSDVQKLTGNSQAEFSAVLGKILESQANQANVGVRSLDGLAVIEAQQLQNRMSMDAYAKDLRRLIAATARQAGKGVTRELEIVNARLAAVTDLNGELKTSISGLGSQLDDALTAVQNTHAENEAACQRRFMQTQRLMLSTKIASRELVDGAIAELRPFIVRCSSQNEQMLAESASVADRIASLHHQLAEGFSERQRQFDVLAERCNEAFVEPVAQLRLGITESITELSQVLSSTLRVIAEDLSTGSQQKFIRSNEELMAISAELRSLHEALDARLSEGFADVARSFECVLVSYNEVVKQMMEDHQGDDPVKDGLRGNCSKRA